MAVSKATTNHTSSEALTPVEEALVAQYHRLPPKFQRPQYSYLAQQERKILASLSYLVH